MKPLYIFDLDGTLALIEHRRHFVERPRSEQNWKQFYAACIDDQPNTPVLKTLERLRAANCEIWIFSGRSDEVRDQTIEWLAKHTSFMSHDLAGPMLQMRTAGDYTPDDVLKKGWLDSMLPYDRNRLVAVFEDRNRMVQMWRAAGVACFQVMEGEF